MIVVSDTSAITNLIQINQLEILNRIFQHVIISPAVYEELCVLDHQKTLIDNTSWISTRKPSDANLILKLRRELDIGESESIALAIELHADYLIIDEEKGRKIADEYEIRIVGLLGILVKAKHNGLIPYLKPVVHDW